jgi:GxxExxY protein
MNKMAGDPEQYDLCGRVIGAAMRLRSTLVPAFLESVYRNALTWELRKLGVKAEAEKPISVYYDAQLALRLQPTCSLTIRLLSS